MVVGNSNHADNENDNIILNKAKNNANTNNKTQNKMLNNLKITHFKLLHQNICGLVHKTDELVDSISLITPHVLCLTEHHLLADELKMINITHYVLGAQYCRHSYKQGGVSIFVSRYIQFHAIDLEFFNRQKDLEICALNIDAL
jgi:hypothetical protein